MRKILSSLLILITSLFFASCGGDSETSNLLDFDEEEFEANDTFVDVTSNSDTAPATLDGTLLDISTSGGDVRFQFSYLSGDAVTGQEAGFIPSFSPSTAESHTIVGADNSSENSTTYDYPEFFSNLSYTYEKTGANSGTLIITGDGPDDTTNNEDFYVNQEDGTPFTATMNITFGSSNSFVSNVLLEISVTDEFGNIVDYSIDTGDGVEFLLQNGDPVQVGYDRSISTTISRTTPTFLFPTDLGAAGQLDMTFTTGTSFPGSTLQVISYRLNGVNSDDQGFSAAADQGIYNLTVTYNDSSTETFPTVTYAFDTLATSTDRALLTLLIPINGTTITEQYVFEFQSTENGRFLQVQSANGDQTLNQTGTGVEGTFAFPFLDTQ